MSNEMKKAVGAVKGCFKRSSLEKGDLLLLACSGGRDSLALALTAQICCRAMGLSLAAAVVDHGIQEGSGKVADEAAEKLRKLGIRHSSVLSTSLDPAQVKINGVEAAARDARYAALLSEAEKTGARALLLAHTRTDQAESVLLDACKTPSSSSWKGMEERSQREGLLYLRPFLSLSRKDTTKICKENGIAWWDDPTNGDEGKRDDLPRRSQIRSHVLPKLEEISGGGAEAHLAAFASMHREDEEFLNGLAMDALKGVKFSLPFSLPSSSLSPLPLPIKRRCCRIILKSFMVKRGAVEKQVETFMEILKKGHGEANLSSCLLLRVKAGSVIIDLCNN
ncbi:MAG: tRNA lysidine(34) synthetase TilS [Aeriscardovia sp.]|nr:tRNA lysidine(34) synthetase TilS [Aeriscardovia sp.]